MTCNAGALKLKWQARGDLRCRHLQASPVLPAVTRYWRYAMGYHHPEKMLLRTVLKVGHSNVNRRVLAFERLLTRFGKPHYGSVFANEMYIRVRGQKVYLNLAIEKRAKAVNFLLAADWKSNAVGRSFCKILQERPPLTRHRDSVDGACACPLAIVETCETCILPYVLNVAASGTCSDESGATTCSLNGLCRE